jgi:hypothetical protein
MSIILFAIILFVSGMIAGIGVMLIAKGLANRPSKWDRNLARARKRARRDRHAATKTQRKYAHLAKQDAQMPRQRGVTRI